MGFFRQEYCSGLPCPSPGDSPDPGIESASLMSSALAGRFFTTSATSEAHLPVSCVCAQSCPTLCNPLDCRPLGSPVRGILQARILEWVAISSSRQSSRPRDQIHISCTGRWILYHWTTLETMEQNKKKWNNECHRDYTMMTIAVWVQASTITLRSTLKLAYKVLWIKKRKLPFFWPHEMWKAVEERDKASYWLPSMEVMDSWNFCLLADFLWNKKVGGSSCSVTYEIINLTPDNTVFTQWYHCVLITCNKSLLLKSK